LKVCWLENFHFSQVQKFIKINLKTQSRMIDRFFLGNNDTYLFMVFNDVCKKKKFLELVPYYAIISSPTKCNHMKWIRINAKLSKILNDKQTVQNRTHLAADSSLIHQKLPNCYRAIACIVSHFRRYGDSAALDCKVERSRSMGMSAQKFGICRPFLITTSCRSAPARLADTRRKQNS